MRCALRAMANQKASPSSVAASSGWSLPPCRKQGQKVTVIEAAPRLMGRVVSPVMSRYFAELHREWGQRCNGAAPWGSMMAVWRADGTTIAADLVVLAAGVRPNTELAQRSGSYVDNGVRVDASLRTSDPAISALGDCASFPDPAHGAACPAWKACRPPPTTRG